MTDKELADKVVALGVISAFSDTEYEELTIGDILLDFQVVRDWRVAGALMEKCGGIYVHSEIPGKWHAYIETHKAVGLPVGHETNQDESLPRAIIEACVEALDK